MILQKIFYSIQHAWSQKSKQLQIINKSRFTSIGHSAKIGRLLQTLNMNKISSTVLALAKHTYIDLQIDGTPKTIFHIHET
jgi:hypothetical protein